MFGWRFQSWLWINFLLTWAPSYGSRTQKTMCRRTVSGIRAFWMATWECQLRYCGQIELEMVCLLFLKRNGLKTQHCQVLVCICQMLVCLIIISSFLHSAGIDTSSSLYSILPQPASTLVLSLYWLQCSLLLLWECKCSSSPRQLLLRVSLCAKLFGHVCDQAHPPSSLARAEGARSLGMPLESLWIVCVCGNFPFKSTCKIFLGSLLADCLIMFSSLPVEVCKKFCIFAWMK